MSYQNKKNDKIYHTTRHRSEFIIQVILPTIDYNIINYQNKILIIKI
jgi:hypothetical protein